MEFKIQEFRTKLKSDNKLIAFVVQYILFPVILVVFFLIILPILLIVSLFSKNKKDKSNNPEFTTKFTNGKIKIEQKFLEEIDHPDNLDFGEIHDHYIHVFQSTPELKLFKDRYFDYNFFETKNRIFLISYNNENEGMSLWNINKNTLEFHKIKDLVSSDWDFKRENDEIILSTKTVNEEIIYKILSISLKNENPDNI